MISIYQSQNPVELKCKYQRPQEFNAESFRRGYCFWVLMHALLQCLLKQILVNSVQIPSGQQFQDHNHFWCKIDFKYSLLFLFLEINYCNFKFRSRKVYLLKMPATLSESGSLFMTSFHASKKYPKNIKIELLELHPRVYKKFLNIRWRFISSGSCHIQSFRTELIALPNDKACAINAWYFLQDMLFWTSTGWVST